MAAENVHRTQHASARRFTQWRAMAQFARTAALACFLFVTVTTACESTSPASAQASLAGRYKIVVTQTGAICTPAALPAPIGSDTTRYIQSPSQPASFQSHGLARLSGSDITWVPLAADGSEATVAALRGTHVGIPDILTRSSVQVEDPRVGGHTFTVSTTQTDTMTFLGLVLTPPGHGLQWDVNASGTITSIYRDGGASGTAFTVCTYRQTLTGTREDS